MGLQVPVNLPAGSISAFAGSVAPEGWALMYGQAISRVTYAALFLAIGTTYGAGDGSTTFNLPDARGRALMGKDNMGGAAANRLTSGGGGLDGLTLGAVGGGETKTLTAAQIPSHTHPIPDSSGGTIIRAATLGGVSNVIGVSTASSGSRSDNGQYATSNAGTGGAHSVIQPGIIVNYIIKT